MSSYRSENEIGPRSVLLVEPSSEICAERKAGTSFSRELRSGCPVILASSVSEGVGPVVMTGFVEFRGAKIYCRSIS